jgi:hypothetical protein
VTIFKINCFSHCGSYFGSYLQTVTVIAENKEAAINQVKKWLKASHNKFIYNESSWHIEELKPDSFGVVDYLHDSDY